MKRRKVATNVAAMVERVASDTKPGAAWMVAESDAFKAVASRDRLHAGWLLTCYGLRRGEVLGLRWARDVDLIEGTVTIRVSRTFVAYEIVEGPPKTRRGERTLPIDGAMIEALKSLRKRQAQERLAAGPAYDGSDDLVVVDPVGRGVNPEWYSRGFRRLAKEAHVPIIRLHDARHTSVTIMRSLGVPDHVVAAWHGHDEAVMARVYTHTHLAEMRTAAKLLSGEL